MRQDLLLNGAFRETALTHYRRAQHEAAAEPTTRTPWPRAQLLALSASVALAVAAVLAPVPLRAHARVRASEHGVLELTVDAALPASSAGAVIEARATTPARAETAACPGRVIATAAVSTLRLRPLGACALVVGEEATLIIDVPFWRLLVDGVHA